MTKVSLGTLRAKHSRGEPIVMVTAYDYPSAEIVDAAGVDLVLAGDTAAEMVLGTGQGARISHAQRQRGDRSRKVPLVHLSGTPPGRARRRRSTKSARPATEP